MVNVRYSLEQIANSLVAAKMRRFHAAKMRRFHATCSHATRYNRHDIHKVSQGINNKNIHQEYITFLYYLQLSGKNIPTIVYASRVPVTNTNIYIYMCIYISVCVSVNKVVIGSDNGLSASSAPSHYLNQRWFRVLVIEIWIFFNKMSSAKCRQFCLCLNVLNTTDSVVYYIPSIYIS